MTESDWYKEGLHFKCTECGKCCTGAPGYVWVTREEIASMAAYLKVSIDDFVRKYIRQKDHRYALIEMRSRNYDCVFLHDNRCSIYPVRPKQCCTFPWWKENLNTPESWKMAAEKCPGVREDAPLFSYEEIQQHLSNEEA